MTIEPINNLLYFVVGVYNVMITNWVLSIPIALMVIYYAIKLLVKVIQMSGKTGGK